MRNLSIKILVVLGSLLSTISTFGQSGALDLTFGINGMVTTGVGTDDDDVQAMMVQSDDKILVVGSTKEGNNFDMMLVRYEADGDLDVNFGTGGKVVVTFGAGNETAFAVGVQSTGKIVIAGYANTGTQNQIALARFDSDGNLDPDFGTGGKVLTTLWPSNTADAAYDMLILSDDKIYVAGSYTNSQGHSWFAVSRYTSSGVIDYPFNSGGFSLKDISNDNENDVARAIALQANGDIILAGYSFDGSNNRMAATRFLASDGSLDYQNFHNGAGDQVFNFTNTGDLGYDVLVLPDQTIIVVGRAGDEFGLGAVRPDGYPNPNFGSNSAGKVTTQFGAASYAYAGILHPWNKILVVGRTIVNSTVQFALARYHSNGSLDDSFDGDGKVTTVIGSFSEARDVAFQSDGKIVVAGTTSENGNNDIALARYQNDIAVGISDGDNEAEFVSIYPNPFQESINIKGITIGQTVVFSDALGRELMRVPASNNNVSLSTQQLPAGIYFVQLISANGVQVHKVVKD